MTWLLFSVTAATAEFVWWAAQLSFYFEWVKHLHRVANQGRNISSTSLSPLTGPFKNMFYSVPFLWNIASLVWPFSMWTTSKGYQKTTKKKSFNRIDIWKCTCFCILWLTMHCTSQCISVARDQTSKSAPYLMPHSVTLLAVLHFWPFYVWKWFYLLFPDVFALISIKHSEMHELFKILLKFDAVQFNMDGKSKSRILYVSIGWLHEEKDCMFLRIKRTLENF